MSALYRLQNIFRDVFDEPGLRIDPTTSMKTLAEWDSVATVQIVLAAEAEFHIRFTTDQVAGIKSVADLLRVLAPEASGPPA